MRPARLTFTTRRSQASSDDDANTYEGRLVDVPAARQAGAPRSDRLTDVERGVHTGGVVAGEVADQFVVAGR